MKTLTTILTIALAAICTTGYAQNNDSAVSDTTQTNTTPPKKEVKEKRPIEYLPEFLGNEGYMHSRDLEKNLLIYITENMNYPEEAKNKGLEGKVYISFVVSKTGDVEDVEIAKSVDPLLDNEAVRIVQNMPKWKPGTTRGKPVDCPLTIPIEFSLKNEK